MTLQLYKSPKLLDFVQVCANMPTDEREQFEAFSGVKYDYERAAAQFSLAQGPTWVLCADEKPIVIAGFQLIHRGVWQDWMLSTNDAWDKHWLSVSKHSRRIMDAMLVSDAHRLQCISLASRIQAHKWYRVLGLQLEGTLKGYGANGEDALMFARTRDEE